MLVAFIGGLAVFQFRPFLSVEQEFKAVGDRYTSLAEEVNIQT